MKTFYAIRADGRSHRGAPVSRPIRWVRRCAMISALMTVTLPAWPAPTIHIIGHPADVQPKTDMRKLEYIFKRRIRVDKQGQAYVPVNLPAGHPLRKIFSVIVFGQQPEAMERYWNEQYFKGISPPFVLSSMEAVQRFVAETPGAIGYILDCRDDERTDLVLNIPLTSAQSRRLSTLCESTPL